MIKKILFTIVISICSIVAIAQPDRISINDVNMYAGESCQIKITMENASATYTAFQFDLDLPEGIHIATDNSSQYVASLNDERAVDHTLYVDKIAENTYRFLSYSMNNTDFLGTDGTLLYVTLEADDETELEIKKALFRLGFLVSATNKWNMAEEFSFNVNIQSPSSKNESIKIGKSGKASYCGNKSLDFSFSDDVKAYIATGYDKDEEIIWLTRVKDVPAGVPVLIKGEANQTYQVPVTDSKNSYYTNMFKGNISGETVQVNETDGDMVNYYLSGDGTFKSVKGYANIGNNKSYLQLPGTFAPAEAGATQTVKVGSAGKASYAAPVDLDFTNVEGLKAFTATGYDKSSKTIWLTRVMKVQKGEGVLLKGDAKDYEIPSAAVQSSYMNMFVGNTSGASVQVQATSEDGSKTNFYLKGDGTFVSVNGYVNIGNNKCYLELPTDMLAGAASTRGAAANYILEEPEVIKLPISFRSLDNDGDGTTAIRETKQSREDGAYYTLQGQRVVNPGKGLYIKNGKKVVIK